METDIAVGFGSGETAFELHWRGRRRPLSIRGAAGGFVIGEPVLPVRATTAANEPINGRVGLAKARCLVAQTSERSVSPCRALRRSVVMASNWTERRR